MKNMLNTRAALLATTALTVLVTLSPGFAYGNTQSSSSSGGGVPASSPADDSSGSSEEQPQELPAAMLTYTTTEGETYSDDIGDLDFNGAITSEISDALNQNFKKDPSNDAEQFNTTDTYGSATTRFVKTTETLTAEDKDAANAAYDALMAEEDVSDETKRNVMSVAKQLVDKMPDARVSAEGWFLSNGDPDFTKYEEAEAFLTSFVGVNKALGQAGFNASVGSPDLRVASTTFSLPRGGQNVRRGGVYTADMTSDVADGATLSVETIDATGTLTLKGKGTTEARAGLKAARIIADKADESSLKIEGATAENTKIGNVGSSQNRLKEFSVTGGFKHKDKEVYDALSDEEKQAYDRMSAPVETGDIHAQNIGFGAGSDPQADGDTSTYTKQVYNVGALDAGHTSKLDEQKNKLVDNEETGNITIGNGVDVTVRHSVIADNMLGEQGQPGNEALTSHLYMTGRNVTLDANIGRATYDADGNVNGYGNRISMLTISRGADVRLAKGRYIATGDGLWIERGATFRTSEHNDITGTVGLHGRAVFNDRYSGDGSTSIDTLRAFSGSEVRVEGPVTIKNLVLKDEEGASGTRLVFADPASGYAKSASNDWALVRKAAQGGSEIPAGDCVVCIGTVQSENGGHLVVSGDQTFIAGTIDNAIAINGSEPFNFKRVVRNGSNLLADFEVFDHAENVRGLERGRYYGVRANTKSAQTVAGRIGVNVTEASGLIAAVQSIGSDHELRAAFNKVLDGKAGEAAASAQQVSATTVAQTTETIRSLSHAASDAVSSRLASVRGGATVAGLEETGVPSGDSGWRNGFWSRASGGVAKQKSRKGVSGHDTHNYGLTVGFDSRVGDASRAGLALSYSNSAMDGNGMDRSQTDIESYQIAVYGSYEPDSYFLEGQVAYAHNDVKTSRRITFGGLNRVASGKYNAAQYSVTVAAGVPVHKGAVTITPKGGLFYSFADPSQYTETGAGGLNMTINPASTHVLEASLGTSVAYEHQNSDGSLITPEARAAVLYEFLGDEGSATAKYSGSGATFKTQGLDPSKLGGTLGVGVGYTTEDGVWEVRADYDAEFRSGYVGHNGTLTGRINF